MIKKSWEFFILFNKEVFYNKIAYLWTFVIPLIFMLYNNLDWFSNPPGIKEFQITMFFYWSFMIILTAASGVGVAILIIRDNGFMKMFKFISGKKLPIILGKLESQWFFIAVNLLVFTLINIFAFQQPLLPIITVAILTALIVPIPVFLIFLWVGVLPYKSESVAPVFTILIIPLVYLADKFYLSSNPLTIFNPASFAVNFSNYFEAFISGNTFKTPLFVNSMLVILFFYILIGIISYRYIGISSKSSR